MAEKSFIDHVELALPARPELLFLARMTAAAVASRADFGYDQIEDLRLALDELCLTLLAEDVENGRLHLHFKWSSTTIEVAATIEDVDRLGSERRLRRPPKPNELSERILDALVDEHAFDQAEGATTSWLRIRRRGAVET